MDAPKYCQSCSMPINEITLRGTEADGALSSEYCKYCYQQGKFTHPNLTLEEMINNMTRRFDKKHIPEEIIEAAIARLPELKRWKQQHGSLNQ